MQKLDISKLEKGQGFLSLGYIPADIVSFLCTKNPTLSPLLTHSKEIIFWKDRLNHTAQHKNDFMSDNEYLNCLESIPSIIQEPDYLSIHPKDNSISFIKDYSAHVSVAIRLSASGKLSYRTMYPLTDAQLDNYIKKGHAWKWKKAQTE